MSNLIDLKTINRRIKQNEKIKKNELLIIQKQELLENAIKIYNDTFSEEEKSYFENELSNKHWLELSELQRTTYLNHINLRKPIHYNAKAIKNLKKQINNIENQEKTLNQNSEYINKLINNQEKTILSLDLEFYERNTSIVTEVGFSIIKNKEIKTYHYIVEENKKYRNGVFVVDNMDNFSFGKSEYLSLEQIKEKLKKHLEDVGCLVGHAFENDRFFLNDLLTKKNMHLNNNILDTQKIAKMYLFEDEVFSLKRIVNNVLNVEENQELYLHNAGNDAYYTLVSLLKMSA
jgi:hypothetical protein